MRVLMCHNRYLEGGGEDVCARTDAALLQAGGVAVELVEYDNAELARIGLAAGAARAIWSAPAYRDFGALMDQGRFDILHIHNFFPLISPAVIWAARRRGVAVVQSLHNYRLFCANARIFRRGRTCRICQGWPAPFAALAFGCYRDSRAASAVAVASTLVHRLIGSWSRGVDAFAAVSHYVRDQYRAAGFPAERIFVKPNTLDGLPVVPLPAAERGDSVVFVGRMEPEKGVETLIRAFRRLSGPTRLHLIGDGPQRGALMALAEGDSRIRFPGRLDYGAALAEMAAARLAAVPSQWAEPFGRTVIEAMSLGTPVIGSDIGGIHEILAEGGGVLVPPGDVGAWAAALSRLLAAPERLAALSVQAVERYHGAYAPEINLAQLMRVYDWAVARRRGEK